MFRTEFKDADTIQTIGALAAQLESVSILVEHIRLVDPTLASKIGKKCGQVMALKTFYQALQILDGKVTHSVPRQIRKLSFRKRVDQHAMLKKPVYRVRSSVLVSSMHLTMMNGFGIWGVRQE